MIRSLALLALGLVAALTSPAQTNALQWFHPDFYQPIAWRSIDHISFSGDTPVMNVALADETTVEIPLDNSSSIPSGATIPVIYITTDEYVDEIPDRENYLSADFVLDALGASDDNMTARVDIRGRGNSSWAMAKKPYRLKFDKKISLCGLPKAKSYVLLANFTDMSLMEFAVATKIAKIIGLEFTNSVVPVDLVLNGVYRGSYMLTNKPGINSGSVDIDESTSVMWEIDAYFDEPYRFRSPLFNMPVNLKDPDLDDATFEQRKAEFCAIEQALSDTYATMRKDEQGRDIEGDFDPEAEASLERLIDLDNFGRFWMVYNVMRNTEIGSANVEPKSLKMWKVDGEPLKFGPVWDFDSSMGHVWATGEMFKESLATTGPIPRNQWTGRLVDFNTAVAAMNDAWRLIQEHRDELMQYIDEYSATIATSAWRNNAQWPQLQQWTGMTERLKRWLNLRLDNLSTVDWQLDQ